MTRFVSIARKCAPRLGLAIALAVVGSVSCSGGPKKKACYPVKGQLSVAGKPAAGALVILHPQGGDSPQEWTAGFPRATVAENGSFDIETYGEKDGAPAGDYVVLVSWTLPDPNNEEATAPDRLGGRYSDPTVSQLRAKVEAKPTELGPIHLP